ncbi:MAG: pyruvate, phosphate dikinase, partial [Bacilli bacterium]|nr:pyruvate, phosphate dikinase [Bacilli bacterium]
TMEAHYHDMQDMEFTVEEGNLYFLQTRNGKRTPAAALKMACDMVDEGLITPDEAVLRIDPVSFDKLLLPTFDKNELDLARPIATGLPAGPGAGTGKLAFSAEEAERRHNNGEKVILVRAETSPEDIIGMVASEAILTMRGGMTSHAAVVARGMGKCCVCGCGAAIIDEERRIVTIDGKEYGPNHTFSIDGSTGKVYLGEIKTVQPDLSSGYFGRLMAWVDEKRDLLVRTNADTPRDAKQAKLFGAQGIGLCRTEHMFFDKDRIFSMRKMILADTVEERKAALAELEPMQQADFEGLYEIMDGMNVNERLLDPPLHEFLPQEDDKIEELAKATGRSVEQIKAKCESLHEFNPMMGHRGCRLAVSYPEICEMQTRAIIKAAIAVSKRSGKMVSPEIMVPLVLEVKELKMVKGIICDTADALIKEAGIDMKYHVGTMIEIPRAALLADEIATEAEFFSFGTNDLTQMTYGFSRDDVTKFMVDYYNRKIFEEDPFKTLDQKGVGKLVNMAVELGRKTRPDLHCGVCGETGGEPHSIEFYHKAGLNYVSCSPFRVPFARLAAEQAAIKFPRK